MQLIHNHSGNDLAESAFFQELVDQGVGLLNGAHNSCCGLGVNYTQLAEMAIVSLDPPANASKSGACEVCLVRNRLKHS